jgi:AcrR family transcriptional regulator
VSPRNSAAAAQETRAAIVDRAVDMASVLGLEGVTIGRLAGELQMSKAGVLGHFKTKQGIQLAALQRAGETFAEQIWKPKSDKPAGLTRLLAICDSWIAFLAGNPYPGGCFFTMASVELDGRPGPTREIVSNGFARWYRVLEHEVKVAVRAGELDPATEPRQVIFEISSIVMGLNQRLQLFSEGNDARERARKAIHRSLGVE